MEKTSRFLTYDTLLLILVMGLAGLGLVMLLSASTFMAEERFGDMRYFFRPQLRHAVMGLVLMLVLHRVPYQFWIKAAYPILAAVIVALLLVLVPGIGHKVGGASRWLRLPGFSFQPSEAAKLAMVFYMAYSLSRKPEYTGSFFYGLLPHLLVLGFTVPLILAEPDLGTAVIVVIVAFTMMFVAGARIAHMAVLAMMAAPLLYYQIVYYPYRLRRIAAFLDPWNDPLDTGYHIIHSFYAFASGGLLGQGPGAGQQKLFFLPEPHTDFIFSVLAEELGLAGVTAVVLLFLALIARGFMIARSARDMGGSYLAMGCTMVVGLPALLNMGVVTALLPTKGLPLPFFSYGGTNMLVCFAAMGVLLNIAAQSRLEPRPAKGPASGKKPDRKADKKLERKK